MQAQIIGIKQLHKDLKNISMKVQQGQSYIVVKNSKPVFRIEPFESAEDKKYDLMDYKKFQFKTGDKNLSKEIDKILYGK